MVGPSTLAVPSRVGRRPAHGAPTRLRVFVGAVALGFVAALMAAWALARPEIDEHALQGAGGVALLVGLARIFPLRLDPRRRMLLDTAPCFAAVILLSPVLGATAAALGMFAGEVRTRARWVQVCFNTAVAGVRVGAAALVYRSVAGVPLGAAEPPDLTPVALVLAAAVLSLVSTALVDIAAGLTLRQSPVRNWWAAQRRKLGYEGILLLCGFVAALPARLDPWLLLLLIAPAAIVRRALHDRLHVKSETRETLEALAEAVDLRHQRAAGHSPRVAELSGALANRMNLPAGEVELIRNAARVRDIGEVALPPDLLVRTGPLSEDERSRQRQHSVVGAVMVARFTDSAACAPLIRYHHERWDGSHSPDGIAGERIPLGARIIAVADTYHAMISARPYREALTSAQAHAELTRARGAQLDPAVVDTLFMILGYSVGGPVERTAGETNRQTSTLMPDSVDVRGE